MVDSPQARRLRAWVQSGEAISLSSIAWAEFLCGPVSAIAVEEAAEFLGEPAAFVASDAPLAAELFNAGGRRRGSFIDCLIAAIAIRAGASLATTNTSDFRRFTTLGLTLA